MTSDKLVTRLRDINKRIEELESEIASLRDLRAEFRDIVLHERGALAESGITNDQINAVLSEFDDRFIPDNQWRAELESALAAALADARRYRWLRNSCGALRFDDEFRFRLPLLITKNNLMRGSVAGHLDTHIDNAMREEKP
jgi:hypothetical protein